LCTFDVIEMFVEHHVCCIDLFLIAEPVSTRMANMQIKLCNRPTCVDAASSTRPIFEDYHSMFRFRASPRQ
jgi:hypothetical protein